MTRMLRLPTLVTTAVVLAACLPAAAAPDAQNEQRTLKRIETAWRDRLQKARAARLHYRVQSQVPSSSYVGESAADAARLNSMTDAERQRLTRKRLPVVLSGSISFDGERFRQKTVGRRPVNPEGRTIEVEDYDVYDGHISKGLGMHDAVTEHPNGDIIPGIVNLITMGMELKPIMWTFAPFKSKMAQLELSELELESRSSNLEGRPCTVLTGSALGGRLVKTYWLDPAQGYSIIRMTSEVETGNRTQLDCRYIRHSLGIWLPSEWSLTSLYGDSGLPGPSFSMEITRYELNPGFDEDEFKLTFPAGCIVSDYRPEVAKELGMRPGRVFYLVREDGSKRYITQEESDVPYQRLLETPSGMGHLSDEEIAARTGRFPWLWAGGGTGLFLLIGATGWVVYRGRRRKKQTENEPTEQAGGPPTG